MLVLYLWLDAGAPGAQAIFGNAEGVVDPRNFDPNDPRTSGGSRNPRTSGGSRTTGRSSSRKPAYSKQKKEKASSTEL